MPSKSGKQHRYMEMCAHNPVAKCPPKKVAEEFVKADVGRKFKKKPKKAKK